MAQDKTEAFGEIRSAVDLHRADQRVAIACQCTPRRIGRQCQGNVRGRFAGGRGERAAMGDGDGRVERSADETGVLSGERLETRARPSLAIKQMVGEAKRGAE